MRTDQLLVTTQGVRGGKQHTNKQGRVRASALKGFNEPENSIEIDAFSGYAGNYQPREEVLLCIKFRDGKEFNGTFADLHSKLF
jgi:hypothetical protein